MKFLRTLTVFILILGFSFPSFAKEEQAKITVFPDWIGQGQSFVVKMSPVEDIKEVKGKIFGQDVTFFKGAKNFIAYIGVPVDTRVGSYELSLSIEKKDGTALERKEFIAIRRSKFDKVSFWLRPTKEKLMTADIIDTDWTKIDKEISRYTVERLWKGQFIRPANGIISMRFGTRQIINGIVMGQHRGVDIAGKKYSKIRAANYGQVVFAAPLLAFGNTVVINHGQGVFSLYFHLSKIEVKRNDLVWKGGPIGLMGSTGVVTGVHLHWGFSVQNVRVDPLQWVYGEIGG